MPRFLTHTHIRQVYCRDFLVFLSLFFLSNRRKSETNATTVVATASVAFSLVATSFLRGFALTEEENEKKKKKNLLVTVSGRARSGRRGRSALLSGSREKEKKKSSKSQVSVKSVPPFVRSSCILYITGLAGWLANWLNKERKKEENSWLACQGFASPVFTPEGEIWGTKGKQNGEEGERFRELHIKDLAESESMQAWVRVWVSMLDLGFLIQFDLLSWLTGSSLESLPITM